MQPVAVKLGIIREDECRFGFHNFHHSLATFLISEGQNPDVVRRMLRQSHIDTTLIYAHMDSERIDAQGRMLERMLPKTEAVSVGKRGSQRGLQKWGRTRFGQQLPCYDSVLII
jgi:hypothetical protein